MSEGRELATALLRTGVFSFLGKGLGFAVPIALAGWFGVGPDTDTFFIAYAFVFFAVGVWGQGIELAAVPHIVRWRHDSTIHVASEVSWAQRAVFLGACAAAVLLAALFAIMLSTVRGVISAAGAWACFALLVPMFLATGGASLAAASLAADGRFALPALSQGLRAVGVLLAGLALRKSHGVYALAIGYSLGELLRLVVLEGYRRRLESRRGAVRTTTSARPGVTARAAWGASLWPQFAALTLVNAGPLVERWVAAHTGVGAVSQVDYGMRLFAIPATIFDSSLVAVLLSHWSHAARVGDDQRLHASTMRMVGIALAVAIGVALLSIWQRQAVVDLLLLRGRFDPGSAAVVADVFTILMLGFPFGMAALVFERAFMALQRTRTLVLIAGAKLAVRGGVAIILGARFGVLGVAAAQPASSVIDLVMQSALWRKGRRRRALAAT